MECTVFSRLKGGYTVKVWPTVLLRNAAEAGGVQMKGRLAHCTERWQKMHRAVLRGSGVTGRHGSLPRLFILAPLESQHLDHPRTKTSWKSEKFTPSINRLIYRMPADFKGNYCLISVVSCHGSTLAQS